MSPMKAIASPQVLRGWSPARQPQLKSAFCFKQEVEKIERGVADVKIGQPKSASKDSPRQLALKNAQSNGGSSVGSGVNDI